MDECTMARRQTSVPAVAGATLIALLAHLFLSGSMERLPWPRWNNLATLVVFFVLPSSGMA